MIAEAGVKLRLHSLVRRGDRRGRPHPGRDLSRPRRAARRCWARWSSTRPATSTSRPRPARRSSTARTSSPPCSGWAASTPTRPSASSSRSRRASPALDREAKRIIGGSWDIWWLKTPLPGVVWCNCPHMAGLDGIKVDDLTKAELEGRARMHRLLDYARQSIRRRPSRSAAVRSSTLRPSSPAMCGQLHHTTPGSGVLQPPVVPRAADDALGLAVERREGLRLLVLEALGRVGVDAAQAEHGGDDVGAADERRAGRGRDVEVAGGVDHHLAEDRLAARLGLADHALDRAVLDDRAARTSECRRRLTPASATISLERASSRRGRRPRRSTIGCGFSWVRKSKAPQRAHLRHIASAGVRASRSGGG